MTTTRRIALAGMMAGAALGGAPAVSGAAGTKGKVVRVMDGDTVRVAAKKRGVRKVSKLHLAGIDAPARGECLGKAARKRLRSLLPRRARIVVRRREIRRGGRSANVAMVRAGLARVKRAPARSLRRRLRRAQRSARKRERGIFGRCDTAPGRVPPRAPQSVGGTAPRPSGGTGAPPPRDAPLAIHSIVARPGVDSATVTWSTNKPASSRVDYGVTAGYGGSGSDGRLVTSHGVRLSGMRCNRTYHYRVSSADGRGKRVTSADRTLTTGACGQAAGPDIDVWHGELQRFGDAGFPQRWLNILGETDDADGVSTIEYRLDDGPPVALIHSPARNPRIAEDGDFNVQLDRSKLAPGRHVVTITAADNLGDQSTRAVEVQVASETPWPLPYAVDWRAGIQRVAQVVDGHWTVVGDGVRTVAPGFNRGIAIGDETWSGLDVTVPVTVHSLSASTSHSGVGVATGWRGHEGGGSQPSTGWPLGGLCFYHRPGLPGSHELWLFHYGWVPRPSDGRRNWLQLGTRYLFRIRTQPLDEGTARNSCKVWRASDPEPSGWAVSDVMPRHDGSVWLIADHADVTFGPATIRSDAPASPG